MDISDFILITIVATFFPLIFGPIIFLSQSVIPVFSLILGLGTIQGKGSLKGIFLGFIVSFTFFRLIFSLIVKLADMSFYTTEYAGIFFLILFGIMMIFPQYAPWNRVDNSFTKGIIYSSLLGFIWAFWIGLFKIFPTDSYEPKWIGFIEVYAALISSIGPGMILVLIAFIASKLYPKKSIKKIEKGLGYLTLLTSICIALHLVTIPPREGLRPKEFSRVPLHELFDLPPQTNPSRFSGGG